MDQMLNQNNVPVEEEIDLVELIRRMWVNRWFIIKCTVVFVVIGVLVALFSPKVYNASCDMVPQTSNSQSSSRMSSLAALAGINLNQQQSGATLSPLVYENIMASTTFRKELMQTPIDFEKAGKPVSFFEYYTSEEYNKPGIGDYVVKYTIGLPFVILNAIRGEQPEPVYNISAEGDGAKIETTSKDEYDALKILSACVSLSLDDKKGYVTISTSMPEPLAAAQLAQATVSLLQKYITEFKVEKVQSNLDFVQERYDEAKRNLEDIQARRAKYRDANQDASRHTARIQLEKLDAEYSLAMTVTSELATQLEQAKINVKETTPILTIIKPVTVPYKKSKPQRMMILFAFTFLGMAAGMGGVLVIPTVADILGNERIRQWVKPLPEEQEKSEN